jgi:hypothetical protein
MPLSIALALVFLAPPSVEAGKSLRLDWSATDECPGVIEVEGYVNELLISVPAPADATLVAGGSVRRLQANHELTLDLSRGAQHELEFPRKSGHRFTYAASLACLA